MAIQSDPFVSDPLRIPFFIIYIPGLYSLFTEALDHFGPQVIDGFHLCRLQCEFTHFCTLNTNTERKGNDSHLTEFT